MQAYASTVTAATIGYDLDGDAAYGNVVAGTGPTSEDDDDDCIYSSISQAISNTAAGGVIHLTVPGVYRENLTLTQDVTIRVADGMDVILEGSDELCTTSPTGTPFRGITVNANVTATIQNLTIRGFDVGVHTSGGDVVRILDSKLEDNLDGISINGADTVVLENTRILDSRDDGIVIASGPSDVSLELFGSEVVNSADDGIQVSQASSTDRSIEIHQSRLVRNGSEGIDWVGNGDGLLRVTESHVANNGSDGIHLENTSGALALYEGVVVLSQITGNGADGIDLVGTLCNDPPSPPCGVVELALENSNVSLNGSAGLRRSTATATSLYYCTPGRNVIFRNPTAATNQVGHSDCNPTTPAATVTNLN